jgi:hypothetical protein
MPFGVVCDLNELGIGGYVAASHACTRGGLIITRAVTLSTLNRPLKREVVQEMSRLDALGHNTLVRHGFLNNALVHVPDFESEQCLPTTGTFNIDVLQDSGSVVKKQKSALGGSPQTPSDNVPKLRKKRRVSEPSEPRSEVARGITTRSRNRLLDDADAQIL